ncbi:chromate transporter [Sphaerotilus hippei]|uniref:Chromate transporter n=1 Tax=Sphaerotilus hippei TaxID=744406 RepID=A0A318H5R9_9BURK|nr:chromate transporter [Sphaerotilus hippei]PXW99304.1 chromate transporter [Sphaerotilus hippei]
MNGVHLDGFDWLVFAGHFALLSLLSVGGAITVASDLQRRLVVDHQWLSDGQFSASVALAQAAPGPNVLFIGLVGWHVGLNAGGLPLALLGLALSLLAILLPSSVLTLLTTRWARRHHEDRGVRAFKQGMAPVVIGMMLATATVLDLGLGAPLEHLPVWLVTAVSAGLVWRTRVHLLWLLGAGALMGALGWI